MGVRRARCDRRVDEGDGVGGGGGFERGGGDGGTDSRQCTALGAPRTPARSRARARASLAPSLALTLDSP